MTDIEKITLKIQDILVDIESLRREVKKQEPQKVEKVTIDVEAKLKNQNAIIEDELKKHSSKTDNIKNDLGKKINILSNNLKESIDKAIHEKVTVNFVNNLYRNK